MKTIVKQIPRSHSRYKTGMFHFKKGGLIILIFLACSKISAVTHYVSLDGGHVSPFTSWATAATNIQAGVNATWPGEVLVISNGVYFPSAEISILTNKTVVGLDREDVIVNGNNSMRCFVLDKGALLTTLTLTNGNAGTGNGGGVYCNSNNEIVNDCTIAGNFAGGDGGGIFGGKVYNCMITGNSAGSDGGGAHGSTINNCTINWNSAVEDGGGAYASIINNCMIRNNMADNGSGTFGGTNNNCTISGNTAGSDGGGTFDGIINNCIIWDNSAFTNHNFSSGTIIYSCSSPLPSGERNISDDPQFVSVSNYHLLATSPCINAGTNAYAPMPYDLDGNPRIVNGIVDMGCFEFNKYHYVSLDGGHVSPFTSWATAATNIQAGVNATWQGEALVISNGVYFPSAEISILANKIVMGIDRENVIVNGNNSMRCFILNNGALLTTITITNGNAGTGNGGGVYCYSTGEVVSNCTITGNSATNGGGAYSGTIYDCTITGNRAELNGGGTYYGTINNCIISGNSAREGGGTDYGTINNCTISGNSSKYSGGGVSCQYGSTANNCIIIGNSAGDKGGGALVFGTINNCTISGNRADQGGGIYGGTVNNCIIIGNSAERDGGGARESRLSNCTIYGNIAGSEGGGTSRSELNNSTISGNKALRGGGNSFGLLINCIVYYNTAKTGSNKYEGKYSFCCSPADEGVTNGVNGNITNAPMLLSASHIDFSSPCLVAGTNAAAHGVDIDGEAWLDPPSIGCDENYGPGSLTGELIVTIIAKSTDAIAGFPLTFAADIRGKLNTNVWSFGDGFVVTNQIYPSHSWGVPGNFQVILSAFNETWTAGKSATVNVHIVDAVTTYYVDKNNATPAAPFTNWHTASTEIQSAVDEAAAGARVLITNGTYNLSEQVFVGKDLRVCGTDRSGVLVVATNLTRCFYLSGNAVLNSLTITNGNVVDDYGGGVCCYSMDEVVFNCTISGNSAQIGGGTYLGSIDNCEISGNSAWAGGGTYISKVHNSTISGNSADLYGGGAYMSTINNSTLNGNIAGIDGGGAFVSTINNSLISGNWADTAGGGACASTINNSLIYNNLADDGGGACASTINNCTISGNQASQGGGTYESTNYNCIVWNNSAFTGPDFYLCEMIYSCSSPLPSGEGNISDDPQFVSVSNYHLLATSPCINEGTNAFAPMPFDLAGNPRIIDGTVDMGCYEYVLPLQIATNALIFPSANSELIEGDLTNIIWDVEKITDDIDGTNLTITKISVHLSETTNEVATVTNDVSNLLGEIPWFVPEYLIGGDTNYVLRFEVVDSTSLTNSRIFWDNEFIIVPEPGFYLFFMICNLLFIILKREN